MNAKKILMRTLPLAAVILIIVAVAVVCSVVPRSQSKAKLSDKYADQDFLKVGDIAVSNQSAYELLSKSYGNSALIELVDTYLVNKITSPTGETYLDKAKADVDGFDKWLSDSIFSSGREVDKLADDATAEEIEEAQKADEETVANFFDVAISSYNVTSVKEVKDVYTYQYAKYLYTLDYLMDDTVYSYANDTFTLINKYLTFALSYGKDVLDLSNDKLADLEKAVYGVRDEYAKKLFELVNVEYKEVKTKGSYNSKKFSTIDTESLSHVTFAARVSDKDVNTQADIEKVMAIYDQFLDALCAKLNEAGATFASTNAMVEDDDAPSISTTYSSKYEKDLVDEYWVVYVKFNTTDERDNALAQIGVQIVDYIWVNAAQYKAAYDEAIAAEDATEATAKEAAIEASKLSADAALSAMVKLYNNYNSTYTLQEGTHKLTRTEAIDATGLATLNSLVNEWLATGLYDAEKGLNADGSNFNIEDYNEGGSKEDLDVYNFLSKFHFTYSDLSKVSSTFQTLVSSTLKQGLTAYNLTKDSEEHKFDLNKVYGPSSSANSTLVVLKLGQSSAKGYGKAWADLTAEEQKAKTIEYIASGAKDAYTTSKTTTAFNELRSEKGLLIYDDTFEENYISSVDSNFEASKKKSKVLVAKIDDLELSADVMFEKMAKDHGLINVMTLYEQDYFIHSEWSRLNEVYDSAKGKWLEKTDAYKEVISEPLKNAQNTYDYYNAYYLQYGYGTMTWEEFLTNLYGSYGVKTTDDLKMYFVYQDAQTRYSKRYHELGSFENGEFTLNNIYNDDATLNLTNGTKSLWDVLFTNGATTSYNKMSEIDNKADWFSVAGWHVLVCVKDASGNTVDPKDWTDAQVYYAEELYGKMLDVLKASEVDNRQSSINTVIDSWKNVPVLDYELLAYDENGDIDTAGQYQSAKLNGEAYEFAVYKTLGLSLVCETISTITPSEASNYDTDFVNAVKASYKRLINNADGEEETQTGLSAIYGEDVAFDDTAYTSTFDGAKYVRGAFGYHIYVATTVTAYGKYSVTVNSEKVELDYDLSYLTPETIIYLARDVDHARIDDTLIAKLGEASELAKVFAGWYNDTYAYDGVFKDLVDKVRALTSIQIGKLSDPANKNSESYYVTAASECGSNDRLKYAQKTYLQDLLTDYVNAIITKFYTPVLKDVDGTNTNYGLAYTLFLDQMSGNDFNFNANFAVVKNIDLTDGSVNFVDEDGNKTAYNYAARNGLTTQQFIFKYMLETVTEDLTYAKEFTCKLADIPYEE